MNPQTKVYYNNAPVRLSKPTYQRKATNGRYTYKNALKRILARIWHTVRLTTYAAALLTAVFFAGAFTFSTHTIEAQIINPATHQTVPPIMQRIANCESHNRQYAPSGQVLMRPNTNNTVDVGMYQINTTWFAQATKLGYDITTQKGNEAMALWIYANKGTAPWYSSSKCWQS